MHLDSNNNRVSLLAELGILLLDLAGLLVQDPNQLVESAFFDRRMDVKNARVSCADNGGVVKDLDGSIEPTARTAHVLRTANHKPKTERFFFNSLELHLDVIARQSFTELDRAILVVNENLFYTHTRLVRKNNEVLTLADGSGFQFAHHTSSHLLVLICDGKSKRQVKESLSRLELVQKFEERRPVVPGANLSVNSGLQVGTRESRDGHEEDIGFGVETSLLQERLQDVTNFLVSSFIPNSALQTDRRIVHLVNGDNQGFDSSSLGKHSMLTRLATTVKTCFELSFSDRDHENSNIRLSCTSDHVRNEVLVTRRIEDCVILRFSFKRSSATLLSLSFCTLLISCVHTPRKFPALSVFGLGFPFILFHCSLINLSGKIHDMATDGRLASVDVSHKDNVQMAFQSFALDMRSFLRFPFNDLFLLILFQETLSFHLGKLSLQFFVVDLQFRR
mmetsp:Transcript_32690/g.103491  ORF Transcript_32690/g.103491 Transcript_32690/m.103491 type:complete len:449 (-) Transcript_32690:281-1627(-)